MNKETFAAAEIEIIAFEAADVITFSQDGFDGGMVPAN